MHRTYVESQLKNIHPEIDVYSKKDLLLVTDETHQRLAGKRLYPTSVGRDGAAAVR